MKIPCKVFLCSAIMIVFLSLPLVAWAQQSEASAAISSAKNKLLSCYDAAREAEAAGANITSLTKTLNDAGALLSQAELAFSNSEFDLASNLAVQSQSKLDNFISSANALKTNALQQRNLDFWIYQVGSGLGAVAVIVVGVVVWVGLKRKYEKAEVKQDEPSRV